MRLTCTRARLPPFTFAVCVALFALPAHSQHHAVTRVTIVAKPRVFSGPCPATLEFSATIYVGRRPVFVDYEWEHSDGARSAPQRVEITGPWLRVTESWKAGSPGHHRKFWAKLQVLAPTSIASSQAVVELNCR